jgi:hypothetical protein
MARISEILRQQIVERAKRRCEYCQTPQAIVVSMEIDHIVPEAEGGETNLENLCLTCVGCNAFKLAYQTGYDPMTEQEVPLFHPRQQAWEDHFSWSEGGSVVMGKTVTGRATIERLRMNRDVVVAARRLWIAAGWHPPKP